jgi:hypothetical protein
VTLPYKKEGRPRGALSIRCFLSLPVVPATAFGAADEEAEDPKDQPDDEKDPEDV